MTKKIGYTSGVFDMFHVGHLNILKNAKAGCSELIVGVSSDELVQSYKGKTPIIPHADRMAIVEAIECVDKVVPVHDRDKFGAWEKHKFDLMFVGDDWRGKPVFLDAEARLRSVGVDVVYFPYTKKVSSTRLTEVLELINENEYNS